MLHAQEGQNKKGFAAHNVTLTMSHPAARLSLRISILGSTGKPRTRSQQSVLAPGTFRPHLSMGSASSKIANEFVRLPQAAFFRFHLLSIANVRSKEPIISWKYEVLLRSSLLK